MYELIYLCLIVFFGIFYLLVLLVVDMYQFVVNLYHNQQKLKNEVEMEEYNGFQYINPEMLELLVNTLKSFEKDHIELRYVVKNIQEKLRIEQHIKNMLFTYKTSKVSKSKTFTFEELKSEDKLNDKSYQINLFKSQKEDINMYSEDEERENDARSLHTDSKLVLTQYNHIKRFLFENSIPTTKQIHSGSPKNGKKSLFSNALNDPWEEKRTLSPTSSKSFSCLSFLDNTQTIEKPFQAVQKEVKIVLISHLLHILEQVFSLLTILSSDLKSKYKFKSLLKQSYYSSFSPSSKGKKKSIFSPFSLKI